MALVRPAICRPDNPCLIAALWLADSRGKIWSVDTDHPLLLRRDLFARVPWFVASLFPGIPHITDNALILGAPRKWFICVCVLTLDMDRNLSSLCFSNYTLTVYTNRLPTDAKITIINLNDNVWPPQENVLFIYTYVMSQVLFKLPNICCTYE